MARIYRIFHYKCAKGHLMQDRFPLGTRLDDYNEATCRECLKKSEVMPTYLVWACCTSDKEEDRKK
jgi:hypothetical protein